jgi:hypothetical protein
MIIRKPTKIELKPE